MSSPALSPVSSSSNTAQSPFQDRLSSPSFSGSFTPELHTDKTPDYCRLRGDRLPTYQVVSDRRGGRTAWSCTVVIHGQYIAARFWYDGQYVNNAREDAAERALQELGELPRPNGPQAAHLQQQQQRHYGAVTG